jgi:hypothetical protein
VRLRRAVGRFWLPNLARLPPGYDRATGRVVPDLANGCTYAFPPHLVQDLRGASAEDLARVEVDGVGFNVHWPTLDVDLCFPALVAGIFRTRTWMAQEQGKSAPPPKVSSGSAPLPASGARVRRLRRAVHA